MRIVRLFLSCLALASCSQTSISSPLPGGLRSVASAHLLTNGYRSLYSFKGGADGAEPAASMLNLSGGLYGTTAEGGSSNNGTVFKITTSGTEKVLYGF